MSALSSKARGLEGSQPAVCALLIATLVAQAHAEPRHYARGSRVRYVQRALQALRASDSTTLRNARRYVHVVDRNRCRSAFTDLRTSCLLAAARKYCKGEDAPKRCHLVSDVIITNKLGEKEFLDLQTRYRIMSAHKKFRPELRRELWRRYAELVAELRLSRFFRQDDGRNLASSIDAFCMQAVHRRGLSWHYCVGAVVWFAGTSENRVD